MKRTRQLSIGPAQEHALAQLDFARQLTAHADDNLTFAVEHARESGLTWREIAAVLGVGRTAAQKRFGPKISPLLATDD
jgi:hypothetical protein